MNNNTSSMRANKKINSANNKNAYSHFFDIFVSIFFRYSQIFRKHCGNGIANVSCHIYITTDINMSSISYDKIADERSTILHNVLNILLKTVKNKSNTF